MTWAPWHTMMRVHPIRLPIVCCLLFYTSQSSLICLINFGIFQHSPSENQPAKFVPGEFSLSSPSSLQRVEDSENLKDQVEQPSPVSVLEQNFIESNISQPGRLSYQELLLVLYFLNSASEITELNFCSSVAH